MRARTAFCLNMDPNVLFLRLKQSRMRPSHSLKLMGGRGLRGSIRTTDESTFGGGRKLFLPTWFHQNQGPSVTNQNVLTKGKSKQNLTGINTWTLSHEQEKMILQQVNHLTMNNSWRVIAYPGITHLMRKKGDLSIQYSNNSALESSQIRGQDSH